MLSFATRLRPGRPAAVLTTIAALLLGTGASATAATDALTVTVLDRTGATVTVSTTVVALPGGTRRTVVSGTRKTLPKGRYAILAKIRNGEATTLAGKTVTVSGATKLTIDARKGKRVQLAVTPAPAVPRRGLAARICTTTGARLTATADGGVVKDLYVVPTTSKKINFVSLGEWSDGSGESDAYLVTRRTTGVPKSPAATVARSSLGTVSVVSRRGPVGSDTADLDVTPAKGCAAEMYSMVLSSSQPTRSAVRLSAGSWNLGSSSMATGKNYDSYQVASFEVERRITAGSSSSLRLHHAAWGPGVTLPTLVNGRISFSGDEMFVDPYFVDPGQASGDGHVKAKATLTFQGSTVKTATSHYEGTLFYSNDLTYAVKKSGWYTLTNTATRYHPKFSYPAGMLSPRTAVSYRFHATPGGTAVPKVYAVTMLPTGLNLRNQARPGSTTKVKLALHRLRRDTPAALGADPKIASITARMSTDGGGTWRAVTVKKISGTWTALVPNPDSGPVTLRVRASYVGGGYTDVTIRRAYTIA